jgi:hypothetical protein
MIHSSPKADLAFEQSTIGLAAGCGDMPISSADRSIDRSIETIVYEHWRVEQFSSRRALLQTFRRIGCDTGSLSY